MRALVVRLFPRAWRERYGAEFGALLEAIPMTPAVLLDVLGHVARSHLDGAGRRSHEGGADVTPVGTPSPRAGKLALVGLLLTLPSLAFVALNVAESQLGIAGAAAPVAWLAGLPLAPAWLLGLPAIGLLIAIGPIVALGRPMSQDGMLGLRVLVHPRQGNIAVALLAALAGSLLVLYAFLENL